VLLSSTSEFIAVRTADAKSIRVKKRLHINKPVVSLHRGAVAGCKVDGVKKQLHLNDPAASFIILPVQLRQQSLVEVRIRHYLPIPNPWPPTVVTEELKTYNSSEEAMENLGVSYQ
jgi:hypothetical protein